MGGGKSCINGKRFIACLSVLSIATILASCGGGGGGGSSAPSDGVSTTSSAPALNDFTPGEGPVGSEVLLSGTGLLGTSSVWFNGVSATVFAVTGADQVRATVPAGATSGPVSVTTSGGTAITGNSFTVTGSVGMDLSIAGLYLTQSTQAYPASAVSLVKDRTAWVRVFVKATESNGARPKVRVRFTNGETTNVLTIDAPGPGVPTVIDEEDSGDSWNAPVPASWIQDGITVIADVDPDGAVSEINRTNNSYPPDGTPLRLGVRTAAPLRITIFPVTTGDGRAGNVTVSNLSSYTDSARRMFPIPDNVDALVGTGMTSSVQTLGFDGAGWTQVFSEVSAKRSAEGSPGRIYYGVVKVSYGGGVAGLGCVGCPVSVGWDKSSAGTVLAHEIGHNFGRAHSPGCGAGGVDPNYPSTGKYAGGRIGVTGWDPFASKQNLKDADKYNDIMNYCGNQWVSDYVYKNILDLRESSYFDVLDDPERAGTQEGLLVWGRIVGGEVILEPAIPVRAAAVTPEPGPFTVEARDTSGRVIASVPFQGELLEDFPGQEVRIFSFVLPYRAAEQDTVQSLRVTRQGRELARAARREAARTPAGVDSEPGALPVISADDETVTISWDPDRHPLVVVRDAVTGEILGFHRGGLGRMTRPKGRELEVVACDGIGARIQRHPAN